MSLINDVLNDLNQKGSAQNSSTNYQIETPFNEKNRWFSRHIKNLITAFLLINIFCLIGIYGFKHVQKNKIKVVSAEAKPAILKPKSKNIYEVSSILPSISFSDFQLKRKFTSENFSQNEKAIIQAAIEQDKAETVSVIDDKGKNKKTYFVKKFSPLSQREKSEKNYQQALQLIDNQQYVMAQSLLASVIERDPAYVEPRQLLNQLLLSLGDLDKANQLADKNLKEFPNSSLFIEIKANVLLQLGYADQALAMLKKYAPQMSEETTDYYNLMAVAFEKLSQLDEAGGIYQQLVRFKPDKGAYWLGLAIALEAAKQPNQAVGAYSKAVEAYDNSPIITTYAKNRLHVLRG